MLTVNGSPLRVLFVDQSDDVREVFHALFTVYGCEVELSRTGQQALTIAERYRPHAVYTSLMLEDMSGLELPVRLRELAVTRNTVVVALTGYPKEAMKLRALRAGFDHYLSKPTTLDAILAPLADIPNLISNNPISAAIRANQITAESQAYAAFRRRLSG